MVLTHATSVRMARVWTFMSFSTPLSLKAISVSCAECGPPTFSTIGAEIRSPPSSVTPLTLPPLLSIEATALLKR